MSRGKISIVLRDREEEVREEEALAAMRRFQKAEADLDAAWAEHAAAAEELHDKLKAAGWPVMMVSRQKA
jgi:phosphoglycolate phosphatase-like HAD superfamily hydrolase